MSTPLRNRAVEVEREFRRLNRQVWWQEIGFPVLILGGVGLAAFFISGTALGKLLIAAAVAVALPLGLLAGKRK